jgi:hypothetical protein
MSGVYFIRGGGSKPGSEIAEGNFRVLPLGRAPGIVVESPEDLHWQIRGLGTDSPVSGAERRKGAMSGCVAFWR